MFASSFGQHTYCHPSIWPYADPEGKPVNFNFEPQAPTAETPDETSTVTFVSYDGLTNGRVLPHEMGHCFNLDHDFSDYEHVTRNQSLPGFNVPDFGDRIYDTPATKIWEANQYNSNGEYVGGDVDLNTLLPANDPERFYKTYAPRNNNFMQVHDGLSYQSGYFFSPGQGRRMRWSTDHAIHENWTI